MLNSGCPKAQNVAQFCILCTQHHLAISLKNTTSTIICMLMTLSCINLSLFLDLQLLVQSIETGFDNVKKWMTDNKLKMNDEKTEILPCDPKKYVESSYCDHICVEGENISFSDNARNLGVYFDCTFSMEHYVKQLCKLLFFKCVRSAT